MSTQPFDYSMILADLEGKRVAIETAISSVRTLIALGMLNQSGDGSNGVMPSQTVPSITGNEIPDGAFLGKGIPEATKLLLEILKKKQTTREIADALQKGGIESVSTNFIGIVHAVLSRARKTPNSSFVKLGAYWGLKDWYPKGIVSAAAAERPAKRKKKKTQKSSAKAGSTANSPTQKPQLVHNQPGLMARLGEYLKGSPGIQFTVEGLGEKYGMQTNAMAGILARLANKGAVEKLPDGKYRYPIEHSVAAVQ